MDRWRLLFLVFALVCLGAYAQPSTPGVRSGSQRHAVVNFTELANRRPLAPSTTPAKPKARHRPRRRSKSAEPRLSLQSAPETSRSEALTLALASQAQSPPAADSFLALPDDGTAIPPDTMGAVGLNHVMTTLNSQVRIQDRTGASISTVDINSFWSSVGNPDVFDPRLAYDPFNNRWIFSAVGNPELPEAALLVDRK